MSAEHDLQQLRQALELVRTRAWISQVEIALALAALSRVGERIDAQQREIKRLESLVAKSGNRTPDVRADAGAGPLCTCGHSLASHYSLNTGAPGSKCHATIYEQVPMGMNAHECHCRVFDSARIDSLIVGRASEPVTRGPVSGAGGNT